VAQAVESLRAVIFAGRRKSGRLDLEAVEMAPRAALHRAGAALLEELLTAPDEYPRQVPCGCGRSAHYHESRPKPRLTVLGRVETERPYSVCPACHQGPSPRDQELDVEGTVDARGRPRREEGSTTYTGGIETAEAFGRRLGFEAYPRGWNRAQKQGVIGDGAPWIWNLTAAPFPGAMQMVDLYHARQPLGELSGKLWPSDERHRRKWTRQQEKKLEGGRIESLLRRLRSLSSATPEIAELLRHTADYFAVNAPRMRYPAFRRQHLFVGSGVVEAGCKTLIGSRLKRSGMFWRVRAANSISALCCHRLSGKFEDYCENRRVHAA
jgi:hypothetical protein